MADEPNVPDGLKIERTASGGFRFDLPRPRGALIGAILAVPFCGIFVVVGAGMLYSAFADGKTPGGTLVLLCLFFAFWSGLPLLAMLAFLRAAFGQRALEVDGRAITRCQRLPPLPESHKAIALEEITALAVDDSHGSKGGVTHYLAVKTAKKEHRVAAGLDRETLEWLAARVAALADRARGGVLAAGGRTLTDTLEADLRADRLESGEVGPEDLAQLERSAVPPEGSGIEVLEQGGKVLCIRLAGRGGMPFLIFGGIWTSAVTLFTALPVLCNLGLIGGHAAPTWQVLLILLPFWAIGIGMLLIGLRQRTLVEKLEFRPGNVNWESRSILGSNYRTLAGELKLSQAVSYEQNYQPVYHLRVTGPDGKPIKFAGNLKREAQVWLLAQAGAALGPGAVDLPGAPALPAVKSGEPPPPDSGIEIIEQRGGRLRMRLTSAGAGGLFAFAIVWDTLASLALVALIAFKAGTFGPCPGLSWGHLLIPLPFLAVGAAILAFAIRQRTLVEELTISVTATADGGANSGEVRWDARSALGKSAKHLSGTLALSREEWAKSGNTSYYQLVLKDNLGGTVKFAGPLKPEAQLWLMARLEQVLGADRLNDGS